MTERFFAPCPRGLEAALAAELARIGATELIATDGGVAFAGPLELACRANLESRLASRILWRVGGGAYRDEHALYELVKAIDWKRHCSCRPARCGSTSPRRARRCQASNSRRCASRTRSATAFAPTSTCARRSTSALPDVRVSAYLAEREATIYLDTSGEPLFKRGYRRETDEAPLRENLAAGLRRADRLDAGARRCSIRCAAAARSRSKPH